MPREKTFDQIKVEAQPIGLFETPVAYCTLKNGEALMSELESAIRQKKAADQGLSRSNIGGWHSDTDMLNWGGDAARKLAETAMQEPPRRPRLAFVRTAVWDQGEARMHAAIEGFAASLGEDCQELALPDAMSDAWQWHRTCHYYGIARYFGPLNDRYGGLMSARLAQQVVEGREISSAAYEQAVDHRETANAALVEVFSSFDAILTPASPGPAPEGLRSTGAAVFNALWTYAGVPCVTLPLLEVDGLPMGVQLVGPRGADGALLRTARWLEGR